MIKRIISYFKNRKLEKINKIENRRKEIHSALSELSFSKKFYSFQRLDKEILLLKIGKEVIDISKNRGNKRVSMNIDILNDLSKKYDLKKATIIHQHVNSNHISQEDFMAFCKMYKLFGISNFAIMLLDKEHNEIGRLHYLLTNKFTEKIKNKDLYQIRYDFFEINRLKWSYLDITSSAELLNQGIISKAILFSKDYKLNESGAIEKINSTKK